jgi:hypothetical protein
MLQIFIPTILLAEAAVVVIPPLTAVLAGTPLVVPVVTTQPQLVLELTVLVVAVEEAEPPQLSLIVTAVMVVMALFLLNLNKTIQN